MKFMIPFLMAMLPVASVAQSQSGGASDAPSVAIPKPAEIRATVKLYFDGKIRQWYSRGDGKGVIFVVDAKTEDEARALMLAKEALMDHQYIPVGPLMPLRALMGPGAQQ